MWWTETGERVLVGAEGTLFRAALTSTVDRALIAFDETDAFGFPLFDRLEGNARLALLAEVGAGLLQADVPRCDLTALNETAIAVVYDEIESCVAWEIDTDISDVGEEPVFRTDWRQMILDACREQGESLEELPAIDCSDYSEWSILIESLRDLILWDEDWLDGEEFLDVAPEVAQGRKSFRGIADDYYRAIPPDPTGKELEIVLATLRELTDSPVVHPDEEPAWFTGIEDIYHGVLAGPCVEAAASSEAEHPLILHVGVANVDHFDITYEQWVSDVKPALATVSTLIPDEHPLPSVSEEEVRLAQGPGLPGGERIERREKGWVIIGVDGLCLAADTPEPTWCTDEGDGNEELAYFATPEAAWLGLKRSEIIHQMIADRRKATLRRLGHEL